MDEEEKMMAKGKILPIPCSGIKSGFPMIMRSGRAKGLQQDVVFLVCILLVKGGVVCLMMAFYTMGKSWIVQEALNHVWLRTKK